MCSNDSIIPDSRVKKKMEIEQYAVCHIVYAIYERSESVLVCSRYVWLHRQRNRRRWRSRGLSISVCIYVSMYLKYLTYLCVCRHEGNDNGNDDECKLNDTLNRHSACCSGARVLSTSVLTFARLACLLLLLLLLPFSRSYCCHACMLSCHDP